MATISPRKICIADGSDAVIRSYEPMDVDPANAFARQIAAESTYTLKYEGMPEMPKDKLTALWADNLEHPVNLNIGVFDDRKILGNLRFFQRNATHPWVKHIAAFGMAVSRDYWGQGIGSKLLQIMLEHAAACGIHRIEAEVRTANERGIQLYTMNGFKIEGRREKAALIEGTFVDEFYIAKLV
jgi:RimJ/RimL family protein N-acetyltransferase